jgi:tetratricopeptide (TPR) repeat protein
LLSVPFLAYKYVVHHFLTIYNKEQNSSVELTERSWCDVFYSLVKVGIFLHQDSEWHESNSKLEARFKRKMDRLSINYIKDRILYKVIRDLGDWFLEIEEYRAGIWCLKLNLANATERVLSCFRDENDRANCVIGPLAFLAVANKKMGNFGEAFKYFEQAITTYGDISTAAILLKHLVEQAKDAEEKIARAKELKLLESKPRSLSSFFCPKPPAAAKSKLVLDSKPPAAA